MFVLLAIPIGVMLGFLLGGRLSRLGSLQFAWPWLAVGGLVVQVLLFAPALADRIPPDAGAAIYVTSTAAVFIAVLRNLRIPGMVLVALGALSNLAAVVANGGVMPTTEAALRAAGLAPAEAFSNSAVLADPRLGPLTDIFAIPGGLPLANVFSVGDVLIGLGIALVVALAMRGRSVRPA